MTLPRIALRPGELSPTLHLRDAATGGVPRQTTGCRLLDDGTALRVRFDVEDGEPLAAITMRDADLWTEDVVEVFLAPGEQAPHVYYEFEINPLGTLFDARVESPHGDRRSMRVDRSWDCAGLDGSVTAVPGHWFAELRIPWSALDADEANPSWRINLFRIDRPTDAPAEFSAWSPTWIEPADFHRPACFGFLRRVG